MTPHPSGPQPGTPLNSGGGNAGAPSGGTTASEFAGVGLQLAACIIGGLYLGRWLDGRLGTDPWLLMLGVFGGASAGFYSMYRKLMAAQARDEAARHARQAPGEVPP